MEVFSLQDCLGRPVVDSALPLHRTWFQFLIRELRSHVLHSTAKKKKFFLISEKKKKREEIFSLQQVLEGSCVIHILAKRLGNHLSLGVSHCTLRQLANP